MSEAGLEMGHVEDYEELGKSKGIIAMQWRHLLRMRIREPVVVRAYPHKCLPGGVRGSHQRVPEVRARIHCDEVPKQGGTGKKGDDMLKGASP